MSKVWFTSDTHFNHTNIAGPKVSSWSKGFRNFDSIQEMNDCIIDNLNSVVMPEDILIHGGDFAFGDKSKIPMLRERINCKHIELAFGNHDHSIRKNVIFCNLFTVTGDRLNLTFGRQNIIVTHEPMDVWANNHKGTIALFGHTHGNYKNYTGQRMDIGVDTNNFKPYSLDEVVALCKAKTPFLPDHHEN